MSAGKEQRYPLNGELPMVRRKKFVNKSDLPDEVIERLARAFYPDILASFQSEEGQRDYAEWLRQQEKPTVEITAEPMAF